MRAVLLAAGEGSRVRPLTADTPKPLLPIFDRPIADHLLGRLASCGVTEVIVNVAHHGQRIIDALGTGSRHGLSIAYSREYGWASGGTVPSPLGSAGALRRIHDRIAPFDQPFIVLCADALIDADLSAAMDRHRASGAQLSILAQEVPDSDIPKYGIIRARRTGRVEGFQEKPKVEDAASNLANVGIYIMSPEVLSHLPQGGTPDIAQDLIPALLAAGVPVKVDRTPFQWIDIGCIRDYGQTIARALHGRIAGLSPPGHQVGEGLTLAPFAQVDPERLNWRGPLFVEAGARIDPAARIEGPTWIGADCVIGPRCHVSASILRPGVRLSPGAIVADQLVDPNWSVTMPLARDGGGPAPPLDRSGPVWRGKPARPLRLAASAANA
ncbi:sugar phosphate nucleotidyltransferase [Oceanomicrobium pacificus]|uniref:NTP transferase domain-containing protein n=1 Tax=Oceanomicrobium pacificus TaxID=2692916 RepID=A0A6B0TJH2_9RHOB|nr:NDP-sugar synthase [Oceanomicrobium pacificus]MXU64630.1 NTP transferase domain-containing protein [Oceanomicrobium pacificus]